MLGDGLITAGAAVHCRSDSNFGGFVAQIARFTMPVASAAQMSLPLGDTPDDSGEWAEILTDAFADSEWTSGFLPLAEEALRAHPGDAVVLCLAATAALLDELPERALVFLKRYSKRYVLSDTHHLLHALALAEQNKLAAARALLERHELTFPYQAMCAFPGGWSRSAWLVVRLDTIMRRAKAQIRRATSSSERTAARPRSKARSAGRPRKALLAPVVAAEATRPHRLPPVDIEIPFAVELDVTPLVTATRNRPEAEGAWYHLRERFAHLGLAQGFDELLCLPHLHGIETLWHQIETARKVLKQFRGRVLLADEVGLGKTIEAGMVLKEYLLRELDTKFDVACVTTHDELLREDCDRFWNEKRLIASIALARRREHAERLLARRFDLVIVDEAHHLRDRSSQSYKLVDGLNKRFLLLLSATPVQNDLIELYNLLTLLKPGIFKTLKEFRAAYMVAGKPRQPANPERLRELMRGAMIRNTRAVVALKLPRRHAATVRVDGSPDERSAYQDLAGEARRLAGDSKARHRLALHHLLGAAGSSPAAAAAAVERFAQRRADQPAWHALAQRWAVLGTGGKEAALLDLVRRNPAEKKLVFVHYRETLEHLAQLLSAAGIAFARFHGSLSGPDKDAAIGDFRERVPVLLSTESGGEGRNIQFCNTLINFDVPLNPMAIEQRIGRIDRIGQEREVFVFNLVTRGTLEEQVLHLLEEKISMFELVVGEVGAILGALEEERDFAELVLDAWLHTTEAGRVEAFDAIGRRLDEVRRQHEDAKALDEALFGEEFETA